MNSDRNSENRIFTIPNLLSVFRIALIIPLIIFFINKNYFGAVVSVALSGISDMLDGLIARRFNQISKLGKILDPIADKLTLVAVVICIGLLIPSVWILVVILASKDIIMLLGGGYLIHCRITPPAAKWYGKMATIIFYISATIIIAIDVFGGANADQQYSALITTLLIITAIAMLLSLLMYGTLFFQLLKKNKNNRKMLEIKENK